MYLKNKGKWLCLFLFTSFKRSVVQIKHSFNICLIDQIDNRIFVEYFFVGLLYLFVSCKSKLISFYVPFVKYLAGSFS